MFRIRDPQESLWQSQFLVTPKKAKRLERSWAEVFRNEALPLIDEERFAPMYCVDNGRPNRAVQTVLGVHLLKEMFNLTDDEALEQLEFNLLWHHALRLDIEETHLPQKTLHNFRVRLIGLIHQPPHLLSEVLHGALPGYRHVAPAPARLTGEEQVARPCPVVFVVLTPRPPRLCRQRFPDVGQQLG